MRSSRYGKNIGVALFLLVLSIIILQPLTVYASPGTCKEPGYPVAVPRPDVSGYYSYIEVYYNNRDNIQRIVNVSSPPYNILGVGCASSKFIVSYLNLTTNEIVIDIYDREVLKPYKRTIDLGEQRTKLEKEIIIDVEPPAIISSAVVEVSSGHVIVLGVKALTEDNITTYTPFSVIINVSSGNVVKKYFSPDVLLKVSCLSNSAFFYNVTQDQLNIGYIVNNELELMKTSITQGENASSIEFYAVDNKRVATLLLNHVKIMVLYTDKTTLATSLYSVEVDNLTLINIDGITSFDSTYLIAVKALQYSNEEQPKPIELILSIDPANKTLSGKLTPLEESPGISVFGHFFIVKESTGHYITNQSITNLKNILLTLPGASIKYSVSSGTSAFIIVPAKEGEDIRFNTTFYPGPVTSTPKTTSPSSGGGTEEGGLNKKIIAIVIVVVVAAIVAGLFYYFRYYRKKTIETTEEEEVESLIELSI